MNTVNVNMKTENSGGRDEKEREKERETERLSSTDCVKGEYIMLSVSNLHHPEREREGESQSMDDMVCYTRLSVCRSVSQADIQYTLLSLCSMNAHVICYSLIRSNSVVRIEHCFWTLV